MKDADFIYEKTERSDTINFHYSLFNLVPVYPA